MASACKTSSANGDENGYFDPGHGHYFVKKSFHKPTYCHHCTDLLWGLRGQGCVCEVCNFVVHDRCSSQVVTPCSSIATNVIKNPVAHCWSEPGHFKRKYCNVCRKKLEDTFAIRCEICEYYAHVDCQDFVVSDCKDCASFMPKKDATCTVHYHHWREGNLPPNSKCINCKKSCWSSECLAGYRCEWCSMMAHAGCLKALPKECNFGTLRDILLPPTCLTIPRMDVSMETLLGLSMKTVRSISEDWSSSDSKNDEEEKKSPKDKEFKDKDEDHVKVFDGNSSLRRKNYRLISIPKQAPSSTVLEAALKTFHISDDPKNYYISEIQDQESERELRMSDEVSMQSQLQHECRRPSIYLRHKEKDPVNGYIRVYPGNLSLPKKQKQHVYASLPVALETTTEKVIEMALERYGLEDMEACHFSLMQVLLDRGVNERKLESTECPWQIIQQAKKDSLRENRMTRYYLKEKEDPHGPKISLFVSNLPTSLSQRQYDKILLNILGPENKWDSYDVIYYEYGSLVLTYDSAENATKAFNLLRSSSFDEKQLTVLLLPNIQPHMIPENVMPLVIMVNVKSGGCQGLALIRSFRKLLNPHQVFNLEMGGPLPGLYVFRNVPFYKILVCGGDGSVGWVLSCLDNVGQDAVCQSPPMGIVPLGTGNDLARVLRWGPGYTDTDPLNVLRDVIDAEEIMLDRWTVIFHPNEKEQDDTKSFNDGAGQNITEDSTKLFVVNNYFGLGVDADVCLDFHNAREENPDKFNSRFHNKGVYIKVGLRKFMNHPRGKDLNRMIKIVADGAPLEMPPVEGIIILNILSWGSGSNPWGPEKEDQFSKPTHHDGMLEIVGFTGMVHMGQVLSGLRSAVRIAQASHLRITLLTDVPVQVDGEPWVQPAGEVVVLRSALKATMLKKSKNKMKRRNTEPSIFFPEQLTAISPSYEPV